MTTTRHTDSDFEKELESLSSRLAGMSSRVEGMIEHAIDCLMKRDTSRVGELSQQDSLVNRAELEIDKLCIQVMFRRQPVGSDLRFLTGSLKMVTDLERIGDLAVNIGDRIRGMERSGWVEVPPSFEQLGQAVCQALHGSVKSFLERDPEAARAAIQNDQEVDRIFGRVFDELLSSIRQDSQKTESYINLQSAAKALERIGDHSTNLAEQVVFMVDGEDIRHEGRKRNYLFLGKMR